MTQSIIYLVGTPIGNLGDISPRVRNTLASVDIILAEDTRVSANLLRHLDIKANLISCHNYNEERRKGDLKQWAEQGKKIALISDAGMPLVSDPGYKLVTHAIELGITVCPIPGPSSPLLALVASGLSCDRFSFEGFLPDKSGDRRKRLEKIRREDRTLIFFMAPSILLDTLEEMLKIMGDRRCCLAREITKKFEEFIRGTLSTVIAETRSRQLRGEFVLVLAGADESTEQMSEDELRKRLSDLLKAGTRLKDAAGVLSSESGWPASKIYKLGLSCTEDGDY